MSLLLLLTGSCSEQEKKSIKDEIVSHSYENIDATIVYYKQLKASKSSVFNFDDENELNNLGYQLIQDNRIEDAIKIFELSVSEFPDSFNPYDSLGEAYFLNGDTEKAVSNYKKSLELNPNNENAERVILNINFQNRETDKFFKQFTKEQYIADLGEMAKTLTTVNPHPYKSITKERFWEVVEEKKNRITNTTTYGEFIWHCSELVANINCAHSSVPMYFGQEDEMLPDSLRFPMELYVFDEKMYVSNPLVNGNAVEKGSEVLFINGRSVVEIKEDIYKHISTQGSVGGTSKKYLFNYRSNTLIPYSMSFPKEYEVVVKGNSSPIQLQMLEEYQFDAENLDTCENTLCLDFANKNTALLTIQHWDFYGSRLSILNDFISESIEEINSKNIKNLVIDLRGNGGGNSHGAIHLLRYLMKKSFTYYKVAPENMQGLQPMEPYDNSFEGDLYVLSDGRSGSTTGQFLALVKHHKTGTIIGEESNGSIFYTGGQKLFSLSNTEVFYFVGRITHINDIDSISEERGVMPDYESVQTLEDYFEGLDTTLNFALNLIQQKDAS